MTDHRDATSLYAAFSEYAAKRWGREEWSTFGRETGTADLLAGHSRLYRSLSFGDDDYPDAVWSIVPQVVPAAAAGGGLGEQMQIVADFAVDLLEWINSPDASARTRKRFTELLRRWPRAVPDEWKGEAVEALTAAQQTNVEATGPEAPYSPPVNTGLFQAAPVRRVATGTDQAAVQRNTTRDQPGDRAIFVVHGRDVAAVREIQVVVQTVTGVMPESLADLPGRGDTIIEKFERRASTATFAIVLLTPDDLGRAATEPELQPRARQNVVLELGYFIARIGRDHVAVVNAGVERPSDIDGVSYISYPNGNWKWSLQQELEAAGFSRP